MAVKLKDGLFLGDAETSFDPEFLELNKVSNLINLSGREVQNVWSAHGLVYLTYSWEDRPTYRIFSDKESDWDGSQLFPPPLGEIINFIDGSLKYGISVLLFSTKGTGRCALAACAYLMCKYNWGYNKAIEFIVCKKKDISLNKGFVQQLQALDKYLLTQRGGLKNDLGGIGAQSAGSDAPMLDGMRITLDKNELSRWKDWNVAALPLPSVGVTLTPEQEEKEADAIEERLLVNSFINAKHNAFAAQLILPLKDRSHPVKFHKQLTRVEGEDGTAPHSPVRRDQAGRLELRSCLRGKGGKKANKPAYIQPEFKYSEEKSRSSPASGSVDLYGFVGVEAVGGRTNTGSSARPGSAPLQRGSTPAVAVGLTVEERLQRMIHGKQLTLDVGSDPAAHSKPLPRDNAQLGPAIAPSKKVDNEAQSKLEAKEGRRHENEPDSKTVNARGHRPSDGSRHAYAESGSPVQPQVPMLSLYDLANMPLYTATQGGRGSAAPTGNSAARSYGPLGAFPSRARPTSAQPKSSSSASSNAAASAIGAKDDDPLAAFGYFGVAPQQQRGGPVRTDASAGGLRKAQPMSERAALGARQAPGRDAAGKGSAGLGLEGRSYASQHSSDSHGAEAGDYRRGGGGSNASIKSHDSVGGASTGSQAKRLTPRKSSPSPSNRPLGAESRKAGWR